MGFIDPADRADPGSFVTTHWSVVLRAAHQNSPEAAAALEKLAHDYWYPLYAYVRRRGHDSEEAKDLTQEFFTRLLHKQQLTSVDPGKGRFRSWLLGVMNHFLAHEWARSRAQKRGGGQPAFSMDALNAEEHYKLEPADNSTPEHMFDRRWALTVLDHARSRLRKEYEAADKGGLYTALKDFVSTSDTDAYTDVAARLGMSTSALKSAIHRLRQRYHELVREEIAQTVLTASQIDEEIRYLLAVIRET